MKKLLLSGVAAAAMFSTGAFAADLPSRKFAPVAPPAIVAVPVFTWTGFYIGGNAGYGFVDKQSDRFTDEVLILPGGFGGSGAGGVTVTGRAADNQSRTRDQDGFVGGAQIGYNLQLGGGGFGGGGFLGGGVVVGIEADAQYTDFGRSRRGDGFNAVTINPDVRGAALGIDGSTVVFANGDRAFLDTGSSNSLEYFGTVRGRLGLAFDRVMVYGTGGFAYGQTEQQTGRAGGFDSGRDDDFSIGYAVGGGVEFALPTNFNLFGSSAVTFKIEGLYVNLERDNESGNQSVIGTRNNGTPVFATTADFTSSRQREMEFAVVRGGINFKF